MRTDSNPGPRSYRKNPTTLSRFWVFIILAFLIAVPIYISSSVQANGGKMPSSIADIAPSKTSLWNRTTAPSNLLPFLPQAGPSIATYESDCTTPKTVFNLQALEFDVCAKATGFSAGQEILWSNANFVLVQRSPVGGTGESTFTLNAGSSLGDWRVILYEPIGGDVYALSPFTVVDTDNPSADVGVDKGAASATVAAGSQAVYTVVVTNHGPSDAINVDISDSVPANTTFSSFALVSGPAGINCINPTAGSTGDTICTAPTIPRGETAVFLAAYDVISGTAPGTTISNTVSVSSDTADPRNLNDSSTSSMSVSGAAAETCTLDCPANKVVTADTTQGGVPGAVVTFAAATVNGNCGAVTNTPGSGSFFAVGTHSIVSQSELGGASCTFTVTVLDSSPPTITCPPNITATAATGETDYTLPSGPGTPTINASGGGTVTGLRSDDDADPDTPPKPLSDPYSIGSTGINWTVTDAGGRTASCTQSITIVAAGDRDPVTISCPSNVTVEAPAGSCQATISGATIGTPTTNPTTDVTVSPRRSDDLLLTDPFPAGSTLITWTATDNTNGNVASCTQTVTVTVSGSNDTTPPTFTTVPQNVSTTTASCTATLDDELGTAEAEDTGACNGSVTITRTGVPANFVFPTGTTTVIYTATDAAGNSAQVLQLVTVTESPAVNPTITAPTDVSVNTGPGATSCGAVVTDAALGSAIANDNCPGVTVVRTGVPAGNFFPVGPTIVTYTATDASGNTAQDTQTVTVTDNTLPVVTAPGPVTLLTGPGATSCGVTVANLDTTLGTGSATDNCPGVGTVTRSGVPAGNVFPLGDTIVTYSAIDAHGNTGSATQTVTVVDNTVPVVTAPGPVTLFTGAGATTCSVAPNNLDAALGTGSATDNCPGVGAVTRSGVPAGNVFPLGQTIVTYSATDAHGNTGSATQTVTVVDNTPPQISCPANITLEPTCPTGAIATWTPPVGTDNCPGATTTQTAGGAPGTVFSIGTTTVTYSVSDANGNGPVTCSFTVTVLTPQAVIQNLQAAVSASSLTGQQKNGLLAKLSSALQGINGGQINVACNKLSEFNGSVQNLVNHGDITPSTGAAWISSSNHVRNTIGCTSLPCS